MIDNPFAQTDSTKKTHRPKRKRTYSRESEENETYLIRLEQFEPHYSFSLGHNQVRDGCYMEFCQPKIYGKLISPAIKGVTQVQVTVFADRSLDRECIPKSADYSPSAVGFIELSDGILHVSLSIPFQAFAMLVPSLIAGQIEILYVSGKKLKYSKARIASLHFEGKYRPEDYQ